MNETFAEHLTGGQQGFFLQMNALLENEGLKIQHSDKRVTYYPDTNLKQQPLVLRYTVVSGELVAEMKLNFIDCYTDIIEKMPEHIKVMFREIRRCRETKEYCDRPWVDGRPVWIDGTPNCGLRRTYTLDGEHHYLCSYKYYYRPDISNPDDVQYYAAIIKAEVAAAIARKKHNTAWFG